MVMLLSKMRRCELGMGRWDNGKWRSGAWEIGKFGGIGLGVNDIVFR